MAEALVDVNASSFSGAGGLITLVTHALGLPVDQGALRVGRTKDVGARTCQMAVKEMMSDTTLLYKVMKRGKAFNGGFMRLARPLKVRRNIASATFPVCP